MDFYLIPNYSGVEIGLSVFLITGVCVGLPALVWAFRILHLHRKTRGHISAFIVLLLLSDLIQLLLNVYIVIKLLTGYINWDHDIIFLFWAVLYWCGFQLHQLVALEGVLRLKYPLCSGCCSYILILIFLPLSSISFLFCIGISLVHLISLTVSFRISCKASPIPVRLSTHSVFTVAMVTFVVFYLPFLLFIFVNIFMYRVPISWCVMLVCLMSLRVISDPLLCVLVCRESLRDFQTPQTHREPNADEMSV